MKHSVWLVTLAAGVASANPQAKPPHGATRIAIDYTWQSFSSDEAHYKLAWNGTAYTVNQRKVDPALIDALYASLTNLRDVPDQLHCMSHTDDYPAFTVTIEGDEPLKIDSESNCHAYVPWNVMRDGKHQVQFSGDIWRALSPVLAASDDRWKRGGNSPIATTSLGVEMVGLGEFHRGDKLDADGDAGKCVRDLETSADARRLFGEIHVEELGLGCELSASPDCTAAEVEAVFTWRGLRAQIDVPCTNGKISLPPALVAAYAEADKFLLSKPVRTIVKLSQDAPRLWNNGMWNVEAGGEGMPMLAWQPKTTVIEARGIGDDKLPLAYWNELGIDAKPLVKQRNGFSELDVKLDFAGKLVK